MSGQKTHDQHPHSHGSSCGHTAVKHDDHVDYLHDDHLDSVRGEHVREHALADGGANPSACTPRARLRRPRREACPRLGMRSRGSPSR